MAPLTRNLDVNAVAGSEQRARAGGELPNGKPWHGVHAVDFLDFPALHQPIFHHCFSSSTALLSWLEDYDRAAIEVARQAQMLSCAEQHGCMAIMTTGMHAS